MEQRQRGQRFGMLGMFGSLGSQGGYAALQQRGPIVKTGPLGSMVVGYDEASAVLRDADHFSSQFMGFGSMMGGGSGVLGRARTMLTSDPPDHARLRGVVAKAFTPRSVAALEPHIRELTRQMLAPLASGEPYDVMAELAYPLPVTVIAELLGVPAGDRDPFRRWSEDLASLDNASGMSTPTATSNASVTQAVAYFQDIFDQRRREPADDLITRLVEANEGGILSDAELVSNAILLLIAGYETTVHLICNSVRTLARYPDERRRLRDDPSLIANAVEEVLRFDGVVPATVRIARNGAELGGDTLDDGARVMVIVSAANRDPKQFHDPETFDVTRPNAAKNLGFGGGIHYCVGAPLARLEVKVAIEELLRIAPEWKLVDPDKASGPGFLGFRNRQLEILAG